MFSCRSFPVRNTLVAALAIGLVSSGSIARAQDTPQSSPSPAASPSPDTAAPANSTPAPQEAAPAATPAAPDTPTAPAAEPAPAPQAATSDAVAPATPAAAPTAKTASASPAPGNKKASKVKAAYTGPTTIIILPPTPMLDGEGKQRMDPDGKLMFNPPVKQIRDKQGHPVFDDKGKPVFQTATNLGYDEKGKKIVAVKVKPPKMTPVSIANGTLTVDGWTGKAELNYDIADLKFMYVYAPGIGITIVSLNSFPGAKEQPGAFNDKSLKITVEGHPIEIASDKRLLGKKPESAWVAVDRSFQLPTKFPAFGYGTTVKAPYAWPGSKEAVIAKGPIEPPPLPVELRPTLLLAPCPAGMMRAAGPPVLPGQKAPDQPCIPIKSPAVVAPAPAPAAVPAAPASTSTAATSNSPSPGQ